MIHEVSSDLLVGQNLGYLGVTLAGEIGGSETRKTASLYEEI